MGTKTEAEEIGVEENISVSVRLRPLSTRERQDNQREAWGVVQDDTVRCALENNGASIAHRFGMSWLISQDLLRLNFLIV